MDLAIPRLIALARAQLDEAERSLATGDRAAFDACLQRARADLWKAAVAARRDLR